jgi:hypothetical protein
MSNYLKAVEFFSGGIGEVAELAEVHRNNVRRAINEDFKSPKIEKAAEDFVIEKVREVLTLISDDDLNGKILNKAAKVAA